MGREDHDRELTDLVKRLRKDEVIVCGPDDFINGKTEFYKPTAKELEAANVIEWLIKEVTNLREMSVAEEVLANQIRKEIREDERERCAKIAERFLSNNEPVRLTASSIAAAIRGRSNER